MKNTRKENPAAQAFPNGGNRALSSLGRGENGVLENEDSRDTGWKTPFNNSRNGGKEEDGRRKKG